MSFATSRLCLAPEPISLNVELLAEGGFTNQIKLAIDAHGRWQKRRCRLDAVLVMWLVIGMALYRRLSIPAVFRKLLSASILEDWGPRWVTPEALWRARERLGPEPVEHLFRSTVLNSEPPPASFLMFRVWAIDGCRLTVPDTAANEAQFGRNSSNRGQTAYPQMLAVMLVDLWSHKVAGCKVYGCRSGERGAVPELIGNLGAGDLVVMDRGLSSYDVIRACELRGVSILARVTSTWQFDLVEVLGPGDHLVDFHQKKRGKRIATVRLRLITYSVDGAPQMRLITNILDPRSCTAAQLAQEYRRRWDCELAYRELKVTLAGATQGAQPTIFRSKTPRGVMQEVWALLLAHNLVRDLTVEAADKQICPPVPPTRMSYTGALQLIQAKLPLFFSPDTPSAEYVRRSLRQEVAIVCLLRPIRSRRYPRKVKRKASLYHVKRPGDGQTRPANKLTLLHAFPTANTA